jgi:hypothetical protein
MCLACVEAELWAAYQAEMARRTGKPSLSPLPAGPMTSNGDDAKVQAGSVSGRGHRPAASECECP